MWITSSLTIMPSLLQNMHVVADGHKNMYDIFDNYVCIPYASNEKMQIIVKIF